jgi:hypothetical protein
MHHLLISCPFSRQIWYDMLASLRLACRPPDQDASLSDWWLAIKTNHAQDHAQRPSHDDTSHSLADLETPKRLCV